MDMSSVKLEIAELIVECRSRFPLRKFTAEERRIYAPGRYMGAVYRGGRKPDIAIEVLVSRRLPAVRGSRDLFVTYHYEDGKENWRLRKRGSGYVFLCPLKNKNQVVFINSGFDRCRAHLPASDSALSWRLNDVIYDFLQVLLIHYLAKRRLGFILHSAGVKDRSRGLVFAGSSGRGKSTTARLWSRHGRARILNDDRVVVRRAPGGGGFRIFGSPWHGDFGGYLADPGLSAPLDRLFFIRHSAVNKARPCSGAEAFLRLYPNIFPPFWDKALLSNVADAARDAAERVPCFLLGFRRRRDAVGFARAL